MSTIKLYDNDAYAATFTATVVSCTPAKDKNGLFAIVLDRTLFFPEEGGQTPDKGMIAAAKSAGSGRDSGSSSNPLSAADPGAAADTSSVLSPAADTEGIPVIHVSDVQLTDGIITHYCDGALPEGTHITGTIDWAHRYSNMQQHTGEHIFSGVVNASLGYDNVGFHLSDSIVTMDYNGPISEEQIAAFEQKANEWIYANVPVTAYYPTDAQLAAMEYRSKDGITGAVRIVTIKGCDVCACCAPHVARTGEVGILKVIGRTPYKGGIRLSILCGMRALGDYRVKQDTLQTLSRLLSKPSEELAGRIEALFAERDELKQQLYLAKKEQLDAKAAAVPAEQTHVCLFISSCDMNLVRKTVNALTEAHSGCCTICVGTDEDGYSFILGSAGGKANEAAVLLRKKLSAKCGGSDAMIQGSLKASADAILGFFGSLH